jgi:hypothetical protein
MQDLQLGRKKDAIFGLGDSISYSENYADASEELHDVFEKLCCEMMGYTSQGGYEHDDSKAICRDVFCGLFLDAVNQEDLTEERVKNWVEQLQEEGIPEGSAMSATVKAPTAAIVGGAVVEKVAINGSEDNGIPKLEEDDAKFCKMLEETPNLLDQRASAPVTTGFTAHFNPMTKSTMWTSGDGCKCYFT